MALKDKIRFVLLGIVCIVLYGGCSTRKNTPATRAYHELTTRYNVFFNAQEAYNKALENQYESFSDNYSELLPIYPVIRHGKEKTQRGGPFDATIEKTEKAIREHSIAVKPRRDPSRPYTQEYREWLRQDEFNPFIKNAWLLMGKAHVQNQDYEQALSVFSQILRIFDHDIDVVSEAQIWMMRAYTETDWFYDAENMAYILRSRSLPKELDHLFSETYTYYLLRKREYADAIPFLQKTIASQKNNRQKRRFQYLLGQTYALLGENANAFRAFEQVKGIHTPYDLNLNALIRQSTVTSGSEQRNIMQELEKMSRSSQNADYRDQIYYAIGNIYAARSDTTKAMEYYLSAEKESTRSGLEKALAQIALGDMYFNRKEYIEAEPRYTAALGSLPETSEHYDRVSFRSEVLRELVPHVAAVREQDSLQHMAALPHEQQLKIINDHIAELQRQERDAERNAYLAEQQAREPQLGQIRPSVAESAAALIGRTDETTFYFDNPQLVSQGKSAFQRRWGNRRLEDNWRLGSQTGSSAGTLQTVQDSSGETPQTDIQQTGTPQAPSSDPFSPDFYLQQLPLTPEALAASDRIIEENLFNMGNIIKDRLQDYEYAVRTYNRHLNDFPESAHKPQIYHQLYLIYLRTGNQAMAQTYRQRLIREFPDNEQAIVLSNPDYDYTIQNYARIQEDLYQQAYQAYRNGQPGAVRSAFEEFRKKYSHSGLMPQFMLLNALSYAQTGNQDKTEQYLTELLQKYPESGTTPLAQNIIDGLTQGKTLVADASAMSGADWTRRAGTIPTHVSTAEDTIRFHIDKDVPHLYLLTFPRNSVNKNDLLFATAGFNFSNFLLRTFDVSFVRIASTEALQIKTFRSFEEARQYAQMIGSDEEFVQNVPEGIRPLIISQENMNLLLNGKTLDEYIGFYAENIDELPSRPLSPESAARPVQPDKTTDQPLPVPEQVQQAGEPIKTDPVIIRETEKIVSLEAETEVVPEETKSGVPEEQPLQQPVRQDTRISAEERKAELERKAAEALQQQRETAPQKSREEILKERERERQQKIRQREQELREREQQRKTELRQREREREQKLREQERVRKEKLREQERNRR